MRRFASVFAPKRDKTKDPSTPQESTGSKVVHRANTLSSPPLSTPILSPSVRRGSDTAQSSVSSSGSTSLQTPDDIPMYLEGAPTKSKSWINSWLGKKPSVTKPKLDSGQLNRDWQPPVPPPLLRPPPPGIRSVQPKPVQDSDDDDSSSDSDDDDESVELRPKSLSLTPSAVQRSRKYLIAHLENALISRPSAHPFVARSPPVYPRSSNSGPLPPQNTLHSLTLKRRLLNRLTASSHPLSVAEQTAILPFSMKSAPALLPPFTQPIDELRPAKSVTVSAHSPGLRRWIDRPCFEHRFSVWIPTPDGISRQVVSGTRFAVPDLEFSEALEAMIDLTNHPQTIRDMTPQPLSLETSTPIVQLDTNSSQTSLPSPRSAMSPSAPSPLRNHHDPSKTSLKQPSSAPPQTVKRGVRFAEEDKEDQIPIGYVMRVKKQREAKARFLRDEKERRHSVVEQAKLEEERRQREEEQKKRELERQQWEKERRAWEKEKRAMEEERNKRLYAEELAASRARRESNRTGGSSRTVSTSNSVSSLRETGSTQRRTHDAPAKFSRPMYDPLNVPSQSQSPAGSSSSGSRPSSLHGHGQNTYFPQQGGSRPSSLHSSSSEDVKSKRQSLSPGHAYGYWGGSNTSLVVPSPSFMAPSPSYFPPPSSFDMPLLPPTAPFMLHQYPRSRSQQSLSPSPSRSSTNMSPDRANRVSSHETSSNRSASSSPHRPINQHQRRPSADGPPVRQTQRGRTQEPASSSPRVHAPSSLSSRSGANTIHSYMAYPSRTLPSRRSTALS